MRFSRKIFLILYLSFIVLWAFGFFSPEQMPGQPPLTGLLLLWSELSRVTFALVFVAGFPSVLIAGFFHDRDILPLGYGLLLTLPLSCVIWTWLFQHRFFLRRFSSIATNDV